MSPLTWWQLAALIAVVALIFGVWVLVDRRLDRRDDERAASAEAERYTRRAADQADWEALIQRLNDQTGR